MSNLASEKISVFPSTKRGNTERSARLISEENLVNIINKLVDKDSFVISGSPDTALSDTYIEFIIHGYYFKADREALIEQFTNSLNIYAVIYTENTESGYTVLKGQDTGGVNSTYKGVHFFNNENGNSTDFENGDTRYCLLLLSRASTNDDWYVPKESMLNIKGFRIQDINVDGGEI